MGDKDKTYIIIALFNKKINNTNNKYAIEMWISNLTI
jgi:hypothetical protein